MLRPSSKIHHLGISHSLSPKRSTGRNRSQEFYSSAGLATDQKKRRDGVSCALTEAGEKQGIETGRASESDSSDCPA